MVAKRWVTSAVFALMRAAAAAASQPAWPPPITMTSRDSLGIMARTSIPLPPRLKARSWKPHRFVACETTTGERNRLFHVKQKRHDRNKVILLPYTEFSEDDVEDVFDVDPA